MIRVYNNLLSRRKSFGTIPDTAAARRWRYEAPIRAIHQEAQTRMTTVALPYDRQQVPETSLNDLDLSLVEQTIMSAANLGRDPGASEPLAYLERYHGVIRAGDELRPTVA